ncbi:MAG TPA: hypothetical protein VMT23_01260 [Candidatus Binatia bacterium]|nr:hypothetical protein [Candidatus Binatia bacterium]
MADFLIVLLVAVPALFTYFLRSNGAVVFLSVCAGYTAASLAGNEVASSLSGTNFSVRNTDIDLLFMFLPMAFSIFFTTGAIGGKSKIIMHCLAAGLAGALFVTAAAPFLNISLHLGLEGTHIWPALRSAKSWLAAGGALYSLVLVWFFSGKSSKKHK